MWARSCSGSLTGEAPRSFSRSPSSSKDSSPSAQLGPLDALALLALTRGLEARPLTRSASTTAAPSASSTTTSPWRIVAPPTSTGSPIVPGTILGRALDPDPARPDRQAELRQRLDVADRGVDQERGGATSLGLGGQQLAHEGHRARLRHRQHEHLARLKLGHRGVDHQVVVLAAAHGPGGSGDAGAGKDLDQVRLDVAAAAGRLVHGGRAELCQLFVHVAHSASTTFGMTRWNASACLISERPEARRAWLARCSARSA